MDSSDDVERSLQPTSDSDDKPGNPEPEPEGRWQRIVRIPFYEALPAELPSDVEVPTFVYANRVFRWTARNLM